MVSHPQESPILSVLFCRFDAKLGPIIVHQVLMISVMLQNFNLSYRYLKTLSLKKLSTHWLHISFLNLN